MSFRHGPPEPDSSYRWPPPAGRLAGAARPTIRVAAAASVVVATVLLIGQWTPLASAQRAIPADQLLNSLDHGGRAVNDYAGVLTGEQRDALEGQCRTLRDETGAALAIVTLESLRGGEASDFANKLFARWGIGDAENDRGLLVLISMQDRAWWIEVGYGLEPILPDSLVARVAEQNLLPRLREGEPAAGLSATVEELGAIVRRNEPVADGEAVPLRGGAMVAVIAVLAVFVAVGGLAVGIGLGFKSLSSIGFGLFFASIPMVLGLALAGWLGPVVHIPVALASAVMGFFAARSDDHGGGGGGSRRSYRRAARRSTRSSDIPWGRSWGGTWGGTSGWPSGGGFSTNWGGFGGGASGGGGAGGKW